MGKRTKKELEAVESYMLREAVSEEEREKAYLEVIDHYIQYYYRRADRYKTWYLCLSTAKFAVLAVIPVSQTFARAADFPWFAAGASSLCILLESVAELFRMKDKWVLYRNVGNNLMREQRRYVTRTGVYQENGEGDARKEREKSFSLFVTNAEGIMEEETVSWGRMQEKLKTEKS